MTEIRLSGECRLYESEFISDKAAITENLFSFGDGLFDARVFIDEEYPEEALNMTAACQLSRVCKRLPIEFAYGFAKNCDRTIPVPRHYFKVCINGMWFDLAQDRVSNDECGLDLNTGNYHRSFVWETPKGERMNIRFERSVSFSDESMVLTRLTVIPLNFNGNISLRSVLDSNDTSRNDDDYPRRDSSIPCEFRFCRWKALDAQSDGFHYSTLNRELHVLALLQTDAGENPIQSESDTSITHHSVRFDAEKNARYSITSAIGLAASCKHCVPGLKVIAQQKAADALLLGYDAFLKQQRKFLSQFWSITDTKIDSTVGAHFASRISLLHLYKLAGRDGLTNIDVNSKEASRFFSDVILEGCCHEAFATVCEKSPVSINNVKNKSPVKSFLTDKNEKEKLNGYDAFRVKRTVNSELKSMLYFSLGTRFLSP